MTTATRRETIVRTDYLVIGAGATAMAFVDTLVAETDYRVAMVDRRDLPGGALERRLPVRPSSTALGVLRRRVPTNWGADERTRSDPTPGSANSRRRPRSSPATTRSCAITSCPLAASPGFR